MFLASMKTLPRQPHLPSENPLPSNVADALAERIFAVVGADPTQSFESVQESMLMSLRQIGRATERLALEARVTRDAVIEVEGVRYAPLSQRSAVRCFGMWGTHRIEEPLYRKVGVHNGPTLKPLVKRVGLICGAMTPGLATRLGWMTALMTSRDAHCCGSMMGIGSAARATIETHVHDFGVEMADQVIALEEAARVDEELPAGIVSLSCGLDRKAIPMWEEREAGQPPSTPRRTRHAPYVRAVPKPFDVNYRMAYVASLSLIDASGKTLRTIRYADDANVAPKDLAARVVEDVERIVKLRGSMPITIVQDGACELDAMPIALEASEIARSCPRHELVDLNHALDYLRDVVRKCQPKGDPNRMGEWYRDELLRDDGAVDRILRGLKRRLSLTDALADPGAHEVLTDALRYIGKRRSKMRYAGHWAANRAVGSGATESAAKVIGQRTNLSGARWDVPGLRGVVTRRGLVTSSRWRSAWHHYATSKRADIVAIAA